jgi:hypothetical protein
VQNIGWEATVNARILSSRTVSWDMTFAGSTIRNELVELGEGIPPVIAGLQRHTPGFELGSFWERPLLSFDDANDNGIIELSEIVVGDTAVYAGSPTPRHEFSLSQTLSLFSGALRVQGLLDYKGGFKQYNLTEVFRCTATGNNCQGMHDPNAPLDIQARAVARRFHPRQSNWGYLEDGEFLKLRELSLTYSLPTRVAGMFGAQHASLTLGGRNLATWTGYTGVDPEVNGQGQGAFNGFGVYDFLTQPQVRTFLLRANFTF